MTHAQDAAAPAPSGRSPRARRARIVDVAELAGVSMKTVSRVVNGEDGVLPETRERVLAAVQELGFVPDSRARSLKRGDTDTIGILIDAISDPFFAALVSVVEELALAQGLSVLFASTGYDGQREREQLARLTGDRLRGLIVAPVAVTAAELEPLRDRFPVVCVDRAREGVDSIVVDDFGATVEAVRAFISQGHRRIGFVGEELPYPTVSVRLEGFRFALREAGIELDESLIVAQGRHREEPAVAELLTRPDAPTAVFCASSPAAISAVHAISSGGLAMPAFISFGDFDFASVLTPGITCVDQDPRLIGAATFERLLALVDDPSSSPERIVVPTRLIRRGSGERPPGASASAAPIGALS